MNHEAESSSAAAASRHGHAHTRRDADLEDLLNDHRDGDQEEEEEGDDPAEREHTAKQRRIDAKRKRVLFLDHLLRELDTLVFLELIALYHLDCSFFWFACRAIVQLTLLTPLPDLALSRQHDEHKPFLPLILFAFAVNFCLHLLYPAPSAGEETRGYLHGGLMIDFIGQQGPTSKWKLTGLDLAILLLQLVMVSVHVKRRELKKMLAKISGGATASTSPTAQPSATEVTETTATGSSLNSNQTSSAERNQDADAEERGVLRRTDTLSDIGANDDSGHDEGDALLPSSETEHGADALDILASGQCLIGDFHVINTLLQEHENYNTFRQTRTEPASSSISPDPLRQLHSIRVMFGVGGG